MALKYFFFFYCISVKSGEYHGKVLSLVFLMALFINNFLVSMLDINFYSFKEISLIGYWFVASKKHYSKNPMKTLNVAFFFRRQVPALLPRC